MTLTQEQTERLTDNGWTIIQMPGAAVRAVHVETGSIASGLAAAIVADSYSATSGPTATKGELLLLHARVRSVVDKALEQKDWQLWHDTYDQVFSDDCSIRIRTLLSELFDTGLEYYDPNEDYEDDVLAFRRALDEKIQQLSTEGHFNG